METEKYSAYRKFTVIGLNEVTRESTFLTNGPASPESLRE